MTFKIGLFRKAKIVGHCLRCDAPIYTESLWWDKIPPPSYYSCECWIPLKEGTPFYKTSTRPLVRRKEGEK